MVYIVATNSILESRIKIQNIYVDETRSGISQVEPDVSV